MVGIGWGRGREVMEKVENRETEEKEKSRGKGRRRDYRFFRCMCIGQQTSPPL